MKFDFNTLIINSLSQNGQLSKKELLGILLELAPNISKSTINWRLHKLKSEGLIQSPNYGIYSLTSKGNFKPPISSSLKRIYNKIAKEFPFAEVCAWESRWFNEFMQHQLFRFYLVVEVEKDVTESVFNSLTDFSKKVFLNPDEDIFTRYISNFNEVIIVKSLISESPIHEFENIKLATLEKLLIDCLCDKDLFASQQNELEFIFKSVFQKYNVNVSKMKRYASRRNQLIGLEKLLSKSLPKKIKA